jgi:uncharacterized repeat protein (TIGR03803 family)
MAMLCAVNASAATQKILHTFTYIPDGAYPNGDLISDAEGNIYGTTQGGGFNCQGSGCGTAFELSPDGSGAWNETILHSFTGGNDGLSPSGGLVFDNAGNVYGATSNGGSSCDGVGCGTVYELSPNGSGGWTEKVIYAFPTEADGRDINGNLIFDASGNIYGTAFSGGLGNAGTVFELSPDGHGGWSKRTLFQFGNYRGEDPLGDLTFDSSGNLYGTAEEGGALGYGVVFQLVPNSSGAWTEHILHSFEGGQDGAYPAGGVIFDASGNLYGVTFAGGPYNQGTLFELVKLSRGSWKEKIIHSFGKTIGGQAPFGRLIFDNSGNLYGVTSNGGTIGCVLGGCGITYELSPHTGYWSEKVLIDFSAAVDGGPPNGGLMLDLSGDLFGVIGGGSGTVAPYGLVFEITP